MRIMIEFDPTAGTAKVTIPTSAKEESVIQAAIEGAARDAGAYTEITPTKEPSTVPPQAVSAGIATAMGSPPPAPHRDTFSFVSGVSQSEVALDAGSPTAEPRS